MKGSVGKELPGVVPGRWWESAAVIVCGTVLAAGGVLGLQATIRSWIVMRRWRQKLRSSADGSPPAGPTPTLVVGNVPQLTRGFYEALHSYVDQPVSVFWIMSTPFVVVTELDMVKRVLTGAGGVYGKPKYFGYRSKTVTAAVASQKRAVELESKGVDTDGDISRKALLQIAEDSFETITSGMRQLLERLERLHGGAQGDEDEAMLTVQSAVTRLNLRILFRYEDDEKADEVGRRILLAGREFAQQMIDPLRLVLRPIDAVRFLRHAFAIIGFGRQLCRHVDLQAEVGESNWVHAWIGKVGKVGKLGKVTGLLMASTQTVPLTALWILHYVSQRPDVVERLRTELADVLGAGGIKGSAYDIDLLRFQDLAQLKLAESVVREVLRLRPPFPVLLREAKEDNELAGVSIPAGTTVYIVPWLIHHSPKIWSDPNTFDPDRFLERPERGDAASDFAYLPFSRGTRMCTGYRLAIVELKVLLAQFVANFDSATSFPPQQTPEPPGHASDLVTSRQKWAIAVLPLYTFFSVIIVSERFLKTLLLADYHRLVLRKATLSGGTLVVFFWLFLIAWRVLLPSSSRKTPWSKSAPRTKDYFRTSGKSLWWLVHGRSPQPSRSGWIEWTKSLHKHGK